MLFLGGWCGNQSRRSGEYEPPHVDAQAKLMHPHANPNPQFGKISCRNTALRIATG
jgi:hypothetical protein